jgi:hypothetical protein
MYVHIAKQDLVHAVEYLAGLSFDKADGGDTFVTVEYNQLKVVGELFGDEVSFSRSYTEDMMEICRRVGICFRFC